MEEKEKKEKENDKKKETQKKEKIEEGKKILKVVSVLDILKNLELSNDWSKIKENDRNFIINNISKILEKKEIYKEKYGTFHRYLPPL
jgi:hypothetical protein